MYVRYFVVRTLNYCDHGLFKWKHSLSIHHVNFNVLVSILLRVIISNYSSNSKTSASPDTSNLNLPSQLFGRLNLSGRSLLEQQIKVVGSISLNDRHSELEVSIRI